MYPVSGGTARFPHFAFGSVAGISFGFFSWLQAVTVAPIECFAVMQYGPTTGTASTTRPPGNVTGLGFVLTIVLMAIFTALNFLAIAPVHQGQQRGITWWKVAIPVLTIIMLLFKFHGGNFDARRRLHALRHQGPVRARSRRPASCSPTSASSRPTSSPARSRTRRGTCRGRSSWRCCIGTAIYVLLQVVFIGAIPHSLISASGWAGIPVTNPIAIGPFAGLAGVVGLGWLAIILRIDAFISPFGTGLIYQTSTSRVGYGLARNRYYPQIFTRVDRRGVPWFSLIIAFLFGLVFLLPFPSWHSLVGLVTSASVLMYAGAPLSLGAFRGQVPDADRPYRLPRRHRAGAARVHHRQPDHLLVGLRDASGSSASASSSAT